MRAALLFAIAMSVASCGSATLPPAALDAHGDTCASCRMAVSASGAVAQLVVPGEEPRFFDDIGCLASFLQAHDEQPAGAVAYVADHQTRGWAQAQAAVYTRVPDLATPMGSHLVAHIDDRHRQDDPVAGRGTIVPVADVFGGRTPPGATP
jgi:copper chaperone NosL